MNSKKLERPLYLDMPADEALARFIQTKPEEVERPPGKSRKRPHAGQTGQYGAADARQAAEPPRPGPGDKAK